MTTHLYCVLPRTERGAVPPGLHGVDGGAVRALGLDGLVAWVSDVDRGHPVSIEGIRAHNDVVDVAMETGSTPVPVRFGQRFGDDHACRMALSGRAASIERLLATMQGFVEMTVIITPSTSRMVDDLEPLLPEMFDSEAAGAGRRYLDTLRKREARTGAIHQATDATAGEISAAAMSFVHQTLEHQTTTPMPLRTISHLISRDDIDAYRAALSQARGAPGLRFLVIGPRAPYSFCALGDEAGGPHGMNLAG